MVDPAKKRLRSTSSPGVTCWHYSRPYFCLLLLRIYSSISKNRTPVFKFILTIAIILAGLMTGLHTGTSDHPLKSPLMERTKYLHHLKTNVHEIFEVFKFIRRLTLTTGMAMENQRTPDQSASIIIEDNELYQNNFAGIRVRGNMPLIIKRSRIYSNGATGIDIDMQGRVTVSECDIFNNERSGINIDETIRTVIQKNKIHQNGRAGVRVWEGDKKAIFVRSMDVKITDNKIYMNRYAGISSMPEPDEVKINLDVAANDIHLNGIAGIRVKNNVRLTVQSNHLHENEMAGIMSHESVIPPELDIYQNKISFNSGPGIHIYNGNTGPIGICNNLIFNNERSGILCGYWGSKYSKSFVNAQILHNTIVSNGYSGQGAGIRNESEGEISIMNNILAYNYVSGIRARRCRGYSYNLLFANGYVGSCCDDPKTAPFWAEILQYNGCPGRGRGDLIADPLFVNPDRYDFNLQHGSPAMGTAKDMAASQPRKKPFYRNDIGATGGLYAAEKH